MSTASNASLESGNPIATARCGCLLCAGLTDGSAPDPVGGLGGVSTGRNYIDALLAGDTYRWNVGQAMGTAVTLTYSFVTSVPAEYGAEMAEHNNFAPTDAVVREGIRNAMALFSEVANITFVEVPEADNGDIRIGTAALPSGVGAWAYYPNQGPLGGDMWLSNLSTGFRNMSPGNWGFSAVMHELGHAIGLKHPGNYSTDKYAAGPFLPRTQDKTSYTVMSYNMSTLHVRPQAPMLFDVAALQYLYGANTSTRGGDSVYQWGAHSLIEYTIWDGGGIDTIDASNQIRRSIIDLNPGRFSSIGNKPGSGDAVDNVAVAYGVVIENAYGGIGNDTIVGNSADNILIGNAGADIVDGQDGNDIADGGHGDDRLSGRAGNDTLIGGDGNDYLSGAIGDDLLEPGSGTNAVLGGAGTDTVVFAGNRDQYAVTKNGDIITVAGSSGTTTVRSVERLRFDDQAVAMSGIHVTTDFNGDGKADILWRNGRNGALAMWQMDGATVTSANSLQVGGAAASVPNSVQIIGVNDFSADGKTDILWWNTNSGSVALWEMDGPNATFAGPVTHFLDTPYIFSGFNTEILGTVDITGDGRADVLDRFGEAGLLGFWEVGDHKLTRIRGLFYETDQATVPASVDAEALIDMTGDNLGDILWRNRNNGALAIWELDGMNVVSKRDVTLNSVTASVPISVAVEAVRDFTGDGMPDILWRNTRSGSLAMWEMNGSTVVSTSAVRIGGTDAVVPMSVELVSSDDFDGDEKADIVWRNSRSGALALWTMNGNIVSSAPAVTGGGVVPTSVAVATSALMDG